MKRQLYNLFSVNQDVYNSINAWIDCQLSLPESERLPPNVFPDAFSENWRVAAQASLARLFAEQPYLVLTGIGSLAVLPVLGVLALLV